MLPFAGQPKESDNPCVFVCELFKFQIDPNKCIYPSKIEWDLTNGPLNKVLELVDIQVEGYIQWVLLEISWNLTV